MSPDPDSTDPGTGGPDARVEAGRALARAAAERDARRAALDSAEAEYATRHAAALSAGWTAAELTKIGLGEPTVRTGTRRARRRRPPAPPGGERTSPRG